MEEKEISSTTEVSDEKPEVVKKKTKPVKKKKFRKMSRRHIHEITAENDIKFRGPLSYRHLRIIGWLFLALAQVGILLALGCKLYQDANRFGPWPEILKTFSSFMGPLFLTAAFSTVLVAKDGYRKLIILYGGFNVLMYLLFLIVYQHYFVGFLSIGNPDSAQQIAEMVFTSLTGNGFIAFNIFIDLFLRSEERRVGKEC